MDKVLLIGEPMELLFAEDEGALADVTHFRASVYGAEMSGALGRAPYGLGQWVQTPDRTGYAASCAKTVSRTTLS